MKSITVPMSLRETLTTTTRVSNQALKNPAVSLTLFYRSDIMGQGVKTIGNISNGTFVIEYGGELLSQVQAKEKEMMYSNEMTDPGCFMFYIRTKGKQMCINATEPKPEFGLARYINHSRLKCNLQGKVVHDKNGKPHLLFFAVKDIPKDTELLIDYGDRDKDNIDAFPWLKN